MERILDYITKKLWDKNYPRTLIIFNINNISQIVAGIAVLIFAFIYPISEKAYIGIIASALLIVVPILGSVTAVLNQEIYEWIVIITHLINVFITVPLYFCSMGTVYGLGLVMLILTVIQSYVLIKSILFEVIEIAIQNTFYATLIILAFLKPEFFINYETIGIQIPLFYIGALMCAIYISFLARVFVYVFKLDYENTVRITENLETLESMDDLTGAFNEETGLNILQTIMNDSWRNKDTMSIAIVDIDTGLEENKYIEDLAIVNAFDACRDVISSDSIIVRTGKKRFLVILPKCKTTSQVDALITDINSQFMLLKQAAKIENGSLSFGCATLLHGMTMKEFVSLAEVNLVTRRVKE